MHCIVVIMKFPRAPKREGEGEGEGEVQGFTSQLAKKDYLRTKHCSVCLRRTRPYPPGLELVLSVFVGILLCRLYCAHVPL